MCDTCSEPDVRSLRIAMAKLRTGIPKVSAHFHKMREFPVKVNKPKNNCKYRPNIIAVSKQSFQIFVILLGPAHVASSYSQNVNMMKFVLLKICFF